MPSKIKKLDQQAQVDLRVTQELKNHNDFIDRINRSIQKISEDIAHISSNNEKAISKFVSEKKSLEIAFHGMDSKTKNSLRALNDGLDDVRNILKTEISKISSSVECVKGKSLRIDGLESALDSIKFNQSEIDDKIKNLKSFLAEVLVSIDRSCESFFNQTRKDFESMLPDYELVERKIYQSMQERDVTHAGLQKELDLIKKCLRYGEKKFESLFTSIDRLKEGK